jgi:hypothetical protein
LKTSRSAAKEELADPIQRREDQNDLSSDGGDARIEQLRFSGGGGFGWAWELALPGL